MGQGPEFEEVSFRGKKIVIPDEYIVKAEGELLPLCHMCKKSRMTCDNDLVKMTFVPLDESDDPSEGVVFKRTDNGSMVEENSGFKYIDGVKAGIYMREEDIPIPYLCAWFAPKDPG